MLDRTWKLADRLGIHIDLREGDVQALTFADQSFDTAAATFVLCSVPDPVRGLRELGRVVKPSGRILPLEHGESMCLSWVG
jgi:phosphatidylethanolamine/phosphatidyl-N-methylethanolamine N-methyltransferase